MAEGAATRVALVSGGNRGIGWEICRGLAEAGMVVVLGSRDDAGGREAAARLDPGQTRVRAQQLDVTDPASVARVAEFLDRDLGRLDVLVNNAAVYPDAGVSALEVDPQVVSATLETNLVGALRLTQAVIPLMRRHRYGRIVNLSSGLGQMSAMDSAGTLAYKVSKLALGGMTRVLAAELRGSGILVNVMSPGWVRTRMGGGSAPRSPAQGADSAIYLATLPDRGPTGKFFEDRKPIEW